MNHSPDTEMTVRERLLLFFVARWSAYMREGNENILYVDGPTLERIDRSHPLSGLRIARLLRNEGLVGLENVDRAHSRYKITHINMNGIREELKRRTGGQEAVNESHIGGAYELYE